VPLMPRRRRTALGQKMIASALACGEAALTGRYVLASRHGEFSRTLGILRSLAARELPSPAEFSMSVHNGLAGLLSIHSGNTRGHTALAAGGRPVGLVPLLWRAPPFGAPPRPAVRFFFWAVALRG